MLNGLGLVPFRYCCTVGTLEPRKNLPLLLRAVTGADMGDLQLAVVGDRGWREGALQNALARVPPERVVLTGWLDDVAVRDLVSHSAGLLYPSLYEGFGFPPLEALALGTPVVSAQLPSVQESCGKRVTLLSATDERGWGKALETLADAPRRRPWVGRTFDHVASDVCAAYRKAHALFCQGREKGLLGTRTVT
jgi:glycosyltransferase involved in cell wall biosynthesis